MARAGAPVFLGQPGAAACFLLCVLVQREAGDERVEGRRRARRVGDLEPGAGQGGERDFALEARDPGEFVRIRASLIQAGRTDETVYDATDLYTVFATDPDGLFIELILRKVTGWDPPFATKPFRGLGQPAVPNA